MLNTPVALHDITDVEGFVRATLTRSAIRLEHDEREELVAEGISILYELARGYEPHRPGYAHAGRFSGYAAQFLPRKLTNVWHASHENHVYVTDGDGRRSWQYLHTSVSFEQCVESDSDRVVRDLRPADQWVPVPVAA